MLLILASYRGFKKCLLCYECRGEPPKAAFSDATSNALMNSSCSGLILTSCHIGKGFYFSISISKSFTLCNHEHNLHDLNHYISQGLQVCSFQPEGYFHYFLPIHLSLINFICLFIYSLSYLLISSYLSLFFPRQFHALQNTRKFRQQI